ncbi:P-type conjugative transfer protein TrbL (plasmid) [Xylella fastidiosa subsp. fastidiosa]|uniref:TrbL n=4 Tax=Xylella fastidiosa TaxID=2371 RepID=L7SUH8_XYLFS|nr:P-type conjugative transfer protein TrbL [Xylella fastidiosa]ACB93628.1 P-type conjugative transfer protein TrbL [Xylella fastidiosa M23]AGC23490.1 trbL [Xylella fastidiosa subsp. multiplex]MDC6412152.1 P-type conjugative transfer protein TrbL [Xylella fastidiosa subsp. multiplex]MDD0868481.1 P-type conjugative transfer protein TrbL [Xylella fastidiosa subsp. multiplex]MDD0873181.1 P-type conjugative transfer protein TrbL [Xylella fastidiosa subsp. multiplex]
MPMLALALLLFAAQAQAQAPVDSVGLLDNILRRFQQVTNTWSGEIIRYASLLFWSLSLLSMTWTYGMMVLRKADIQEFLAETIRFFAIMGFFWWLLINAPAMSTAIIDSLRQIAANATGLDNTLSPSGIVDIGFDITSKVIDDSSITSPVNSAVGIIASTVILIVLALIAVNMLLLLVSGWLLSYGAVFLLGFGGGRWTSDIAISYYKTVIGLGMQLFAMILIIGIGRSFIDQYYAAVMASTITIKALLVMLVASIVLLSLVNKIPPMFASIVGGGGATAGIGNFGAGAAIAAAATGAAVAATAGSAIAAGVSSAGGGVSALKAAFQSAQQNMASGGGSGSGSGGNSAGVSSGGSSSFMSAMGTTGRFAADMGTSLAKGVGQVVKDKAGSMIASAKERVADTTGGKVASAIRNNIGAMSGQDDFKGDSLAGAAQRGSETAMHDEVAAFVNKGKQHE